MELNLNKHISGQFNSELEKVRNHVLVMGGVVEQQLNDALKAIQTRDADLATQVLENDVQINACEVSIDEECTHIIAKRQPAASDLRLIMAIVKTTADLERIGDEVCRIARLAFDALEQPELLVNLDAMGRHVSKMLHNVLDAFARMDSDAAFAVHKEDISIDQEYKMILQQLMDSMRKNPDMIPAIMEFTWSVRSLERIGDRCQNISEYIIYFVRGKDVRHISREDIEKDLYDGKK